jgi:predicted dehydrogenase
MAEKASLKNGVVQDKLFLPGLVKLKGLIDEGLLGRILSVRGEFGYWVFEGDGVEPQRPSWNYRAEDGGGIIFDMFTHWEYVLANLFGEVRAVSALGATHIPKRWDESHQPYDVTAADAAYAVFQLEGGVIAQINSSWTVRVRRDDLLTFQVDGTGGSAVAGLHECFFQPAAATPPIVWNPDVEAPANYYDNWTPVGDDRRYDNPFKVQWEKFLRHVADDEPFGWTLREAAKGVQLAEKARESWEKRRWVDIPQLQD